MKKLVTLILIVFTLSCVHSQAQETEKKAFGIKLSGFVKNDAFYDSRQVTAAREGHFLLWPKNESLDANGEDINAKSSFNMLSIQSRLTGKITGPDAFGAKTSGVIEGDFFGQANDNINLFRLRHAFIKLNWTNTELITGQYWNPLFVTGCFPGTVSFNTGVPLQSFARNPQIRVTQKVGNLKLIGALLSQRDYTSRGSAGATSAYLSNSGVPDLHVQVHYETTNFLGGVGVAYKTIVPRLYNTVELAPASTEVVLNMADSTTTIVTTDAITEKYKVDEKVSGMTLIGFAKFKTNPVTVKVQGRYGENIPDVLSISGFAVKNVKDATTGELEYTPLKNISFWGDIHTNGKKFQAGIFGGYTQNLGTKETMILAPDADPTIYGLGTDIESLLRVSPRVMFNSGKFRVAFEVEYTQANYGSGYDADYKPASTTTVSNVRTLLSTYLFF